jgi:hypothetical protein
LPAGLNDYWKAQYPPVDQRWAAISDYMVRGGQQMASYLGMGPLVVALLPAAGGVATLVWLRRTPVALVVPALLAEIVVLGALEQYPLFNLRTSHFLLTAFAVTAAIGVTVSAPLVARVHGAVAVVAVALFVTNPAVQNAVRCKRLPAEDLRTSTRYIAEHLQPTDIVVVAILSSWGFKYYWTGPRRPSSPRRPTCKGSSRLFPISRTSSSRPTERRRRWDQAVARPGEIGPGARIWAVTTTSIHPKPRPSPPPRRRTE